MAKDWILSFYHRCCKTFNLVVRLISRRGGTGSLPGLVRHLFTSTQEVEQSHLQRKQLLLPDTQAQLLGVQILKTMIAGR